MSEAAVRERALKRDWATPGGFRDWLMRLLKIVLPVGVLVLLAYLFVTPLSQDKEISFLLDKNKVETARERLKVQSAQYRGLDDKGRPFTVEAAQAVQATSNVPVVDINGMAARIQLTDGPATLEAQRGRYDMDTQKMDVLGPILFTASDGYRMETSDVTIDLGEQKLASGGGVEGRMPLGTFRAGSMEVDLQGRRVVLSGRARLHIVQGALRGKR
ncbi:MAG TPA: LPS export ABC transporter periplasmic protein LptC [Allosphingosinicella sp.]|jgi:lipopolysaccharide export system protein LptC